jgi:formate dehydrogenase iron-sulfur subunit
MDRNSFYGPVDPARDAGWVDPPARKGFFTDTSICIGCKACEVACKEWNAVPEDGMSLTGMSYDNSVGLGASTWRHVAFIEQPASFGTQESGVLHGESHANLDVLALAGGHGDPAPPPAAVDLGMPLPTLPGAGGEDSSVPFRWLMESDVCKHCTHAACLDVCPTGALFRTEFGTVVVQDDICNGCGYCVPACPYGVIERREGPKNDHAVGVAQKCTLCYDRLGEGMEPACAKACPTQSIQFGDLDELRQRADVRVAELVEAGVVDAQLYGHDPADGVGGAGAFFLLLDKPEVTTKALPAMWGRAAMAAGTMLAGAAMAFLGSRR